MNPHLWLLIAVLCTASACGRGQTETEMVGDHPVFTWMGGAVSEVSVFRLEGETLAHEEEIWRITCGTERCITSPLRLGDVPQGSREVTAFSGELRAGNYEAVTSTVQDVDNDVFVDNTFFAVEQDTELEPNQPRSPFASLLEELLCCAP